MSLYLYMCVCIYMYICIYQYMCIHMYIYICIYVYMCVYICIFMYIGVWGVDPPKREIFLPAGVFSECVREQLGRASFGSLTLFWKLVSDRPSVRPSDRKK